MPGLELLLLALLAGAGLLLARDLGGSGRARREEERARLERLGNGAPGHEEPPPPRPGRVERRLRAAGLDVGWPLSAGVALLAAVLAFLAVGTLVPRLPLVAVLAALLAPLGLWLGVLGWGRRRARRFEARLAEAVGFMVAALEAGQNRVKSFASAAESSDGMVARELRGVTRRLDLGMEIQPAMQPILDGYDSPGVRLFVQTVVAKWRLGGDLAPVLASVARVLRERLHVRLRLRRQLAGARLSAVLIALLPYLAIPLFLKVFPELIDQLVSHPLGPRLLVTAILLQVAGFLWLRRIFRMEL